MTAQTTREVGASPRQLSQAVLGEVDVTYPITPSAFLRLDMDEVVAQVAAQGSRFALDLFVASVADAAQFARAFLELRCMVERAVCEGRYGDIERLIAAAPASLPEMMDRFLDQ